MQLALTADDVNRLTLDQRKAAHAALYVALIADGTPSAEELRTFEHAMQSLPWETPHDLHADRQNAIRAHLATADNQAKLAFVASIAASLPDPALRERLIETMLQIASADGRLTRGERGSVNAMLAVFGVSEAQLADLRAKFGSR